MSVIMRFDRDGFHPLRGIPLETRIRAAVRRCIVDEIQHLVDMLDELDADPDLEDSADDEPSLGWTRTMGWGSADDREEPDVILLGGEA